VVGDLGRKLGLGLEEAAEAILAVVNQRMAGRIRLLSIERGLDPRDFALVAFGGAGPLHGGALVREVGVGTMLVPEYPGVLCAMGCAIADFRYDFSQTLEQRLDLIPPSQIAAVLEDQQQEGASKLRSHGLLDAEISTAHVADMSYAGQIHSLRVPIELGWPADRLRDAFVDMYRQEFGNTLGDVPVMAVNLRTIATGSRRVASAAVSSKRASGPPEPRSRRPVYVGGWHDTPIYRREDLVPGHGFAGPAVIEQTDTTTLVEPGLSVAVDAAGNLLVGAR
jgi:N-methylhydantoinase A